MTSSSATPSPYKKFVELLSSLFNTPEQIRSFAKEYIELQAIARDVNFTCAHSECIAEIVDWLERHGLDIQFFDVLAIHFEARRDEIEAVARAWRAGTCDVAAIAAADVSPRVVKTYEITQANLSELMALMTMATRVHEIQEEQGFSVSFEIRLTAHVHDG